MQKSTFGFSDLVGEIERIVGPEAATSAQRQAAPNPRACTAPAALPVQTVCATGFSIAACPKILLVEDNEENRDALSRRLVRRGYEVVMATDGRQGLAMAARSGRPTSSCST